MIKLKKLFIFFLCLCFLLATGGCADKPSDTTNRIITPKNNSIPLQGKWVIEKCLTNTSESTTGKVSGEWAGKTAEFAMDAVILGEYFWKNVSYKLKRVNAEEYFLYKYKDSIKKLGIDDREVYVITVSSGDNFLYDFVKTGDNEIIANIDDDFYCLKKLSDKVDTNFYSEIAGMQAKETTYSRHSNQPPSSGLLLGIRTPVKADSQVELLNTDKYSYRTLWIASENRILHPVLEADDIFLPRKSGFWKIQVGEAVGNRAVEDVLTAYSISDKGLKKTPDMKLNPIFWGDKEGVTRKAILYAGNDYVSVEVKGSGTYIGDSKAWGENSLQTLPVDSISNSRGVKLADIAGDVGTLAMKNAMENLANSSNVKGVYEIDEGVQDENFALYRKTGHWFFKGRLNFQKQDEVPFLDFNINLIPPTELVMYDTLHIPWTNIKDKVPEAVDAFTSPDRDMAVVISKNQLFIYSIENGKLGDSPLKKIKLKQGDTVMMAEWATREYVGYWEKAFIKNNKTREVK